MDNPERQTAFDRDRFQQFTHEFKGALIQPSDPEYETARSVWNGMIDRRPALIARCVSPDDVAMATQFAFEAGPVIAWAERLKAEGIT